MNIQYLVCGEAHTMAFIWSYIFPFRLKANLNTKTNSKETYLILLNMLITYRNKRQ